jgi:transcriptional antiterminator NusG
LALRAGSQEPGSGADWPECRAALRAFTGVRCGSASTLSAHFRTPGAFGSPSCGGEQPIWNCCGAYSNFEKKVAESIEEKAKQKGLDHLFEKILVPTEKVVEVRRGRKVDSERKFFPGYVLVRANLTDEAYHLIKNTPKVTGFLGSDNKPVPIPDYEAERILGQVQEGVERPKASVSFEIGEQVRVSDGPFASFNGTVQDVDEERSRLKVEVSIFGRATPVELEYSQVEKV